MNDLEVNENCLKVRHLARKLSELQANATKEQNLALFITLSDIEMAARRAQNRMNELDYPKGFPEEQMGS